QARSADSRSGDRRTYSELHPSGGVRFAADPLDPGGDSPVVAAAFPAEPGAAIRAAALAWHFAPGSAAVAPHAAHAVDAVADRHPHLLLLGGIERVVHGEPGLAHLLLRRFHLGAHLGAQLIAQLRELLEVGAGLVDLGAQLGARLLAPGAHRA